MTGRSDPVEPTGRRATSNHRGRRLPSASALAAVVLPLAALVWVLLPVILGTETFFLRDLFAAQLALRDALADGLAAGKVPLIDAHRLGQPLAGNPNAVPLYPTAALHLVAPLMWAFNAHLWLHFLVAPWAMAWLGRELGLGRRAAWAAGVVFAFGGHYASQLVFLNLVAGVTLSPALAAAVLGTLARARVGGWRAATGHAAAAGALWGLVLLGGDPMTALLAAAVAATVALPESIAVVRGAGARRASVAAGGLLAAGLAAGTLLALPQIVELLRIVPVSARGQLGFSQAVGLAGSFDPRQTLEWLIPFAFGRSDLLAAGSFWGYRFYQGNWAFFYTLYPGFAAIALLAAAGLPWRRGGLAERLRRPALAGAALAVVGVFFALGAFNPVAGWLLTLPALDVLRFPSKFWLLAAVGLSLLAGVGFERALVAGGKQALRRALAMVLALGALVAGLWTALTVRPRSAAAILHSLMPEGAPAWMATAEVERWSGLALISALLAAVLAAILLFARRRPAAAGALLLCVHAASQLFLLAPARATDAVLPYTLPSRLLEVLPADEVIVHGTAQDLFGQSTLAEARFPEPRAAWVFRRAFQEVYPLAGGLWGRRYDLVTSPEALDTLPSRRAFSAVQRASDDRTRLRLLAAWGTQRLVVDRRFAEADVEGLAELVAATSSFGRRVWVYRLSDPAPAVVLAARVTVVDGPRAVARSLAREDFRRGREAVVSRRGPGAAVLDDGLPGGEGRTGAGDPRDEIGAGRVRVLLEDEESLVVEVDAPTGGLVVWRRVWLPIYRATVDGVAAPTLTANLHHLGVPVPPGHHRVEVALDRRPLNLSFTGAALGAVALVALAGWPWRRRRHLHRAAGPGTGGVEGR